jgi:Tfp pilus assembly protein PilF
MTAYQQAVTAAPDEYLLLTGLGMAYLRGNNPAAARPHLARSVQANGNYYLSRMGLGYVLLEQKEPARGIEQLEASMRLLPTAEGAFFLAEGYQQTGQRQKAAELFRAVAEADPQGKLGRAAGARLKALGG